MCQCEFTTGLAADPPWMKRRLPVIARPLGRSNPVRDKLPAACHERDCFGQAASQ
jgi:hypothetical protein